VLLELGAGFDPEHSGRENVYLRAAVLGLSAAETRAQFDELVAFAELDSVIDRPVKTYSSGMYARLAFAVSVASAPDVLLIDEALAVGDAAFQRKCYARLEAIKQTGCALLFVSHSSDAVLQLCDRACFMEAGECLRVGAPKDVLDHYHRLVFSPPESVAAVRAEVLAAPGAVAAFDPGLHSKSRLEYVARGARIVEAFITTEAGCRVNVLRCGGRYQYHLRVAFEQEYDGVRFGMLLKTVAGAELGGGAWPPAGERLRCAAGELRSFAFGFTCALLPGTYFLNCGVQGDLAGVVTYLHRVIDAVAFRVEGGWGLGTGVVDFAVAACPEGGTLTGADCQL
jgi:lipopolysaccharide transport system ATP-binding protein